ncbi:malonate transporter subunit MadM [Allomuricauda sp. NBRC 101325]|uniref:malonate transporter subunit MadM n=1 Tax=Allomuricauda sp. NBRC 101325 TaxID=1113758 RepID=UPI0024A1F604|nr:malonate transporter subunit MadM [Muricauda sp. NBRC 101325]GLU42464.1 malonate transporter subunit MadM [Muricauda sp. NBRC 101325]
MEIIDNVIGKNGLVFAFLCVGIIILFSTWVSKYVTHKKIPGVAIAIIIGLSLAFLGNEKGISNIPLFAGMALLGGPMLRDFAVVATAMSADLSKIKQAGLAGLVSLILGVSVSFILGILIGLSMGYTNTESLTTIGAGACTYIVGPVTGTALGASSDVIAISVATGVVKTICTTICTPLIAKKIQLDNPHAAIVFGGLLGTTSGVVAGLAATDEELVPYGALTSTFYTGLGCLLCPSLFFVILRSILM